MVRRRSIPEPTLVAHQRQIEELCALCRAEGRFAFDTEFVMEDRYESEVCLIQIATQATTSIIDPFLDLNLRPIWNLVSNPEVETVVHAGQEDLALSVQPTGRVPRNVFDVQLVAGLIGHDYPLSLQRLVQAILHIRLHKSKTLTDWRRRPLSAAQIRYGAEDVAYLLEVRGILKDRLVKLARVEWAREELKRFEDLSLYRRAEEDKIARIKGAGSLTGQQLAIVRELRAWRESFAQKVNRPVRIVLKDYLLVEIAKHQMTEFSEIRALRGLNLADRNIHTLCRLVKRALAIPSDKWPAPRPREHETPQEASLVALATAVIRGYCLENGLAYGLVATQKSIKDLIRYQAKQPRGSRKGIELLDGWRGKAVGAMLDDVLAGRRSVQVKRVNGEPIVHVLLPPDDAIN